jgi:hypothetical protein
VATAAIPIRKIRVDSTLSTSVSRSSALPPPVRKILKAWLFPHVLKYITTTLSGDLGKLSLEQAGDLYGPLFQFHLEVTRVLASWAKRSRLERAVTGWWAKRVQMQADRLGDIVEALAWGSDPDLRQFIDESVASLESRHR